MYFSFIATSYAFLIKSLPINAEAIISRVDFGIWKFVIIEFAILNSYGGKINLFDQPLILFKVPLEETELQ